MNPGDLALRVTTPPPSLEPPMEGTIVFGDGAAVFVAGAGPITIEGQLVARVTLALLGGSPGHIDPTHPGTHPAAGGAGHIVPSGPGHIV